MAPSNVSRPPLKTILCLLNGLADAPLEDLGGKTPLEAASTPNLDKLLKKGMLSHVTPPVCGGHETALLAALSGRSPLQSLARGPLEAYAIGRPPLDGEVAFSFAFVSIGQDTVVDVAENLLSDHEGKKLCEELSLAWEDRGVSFLSLTGGVGVVVGSYRGLREACTLGLSMQPGEMLGKSWSKGLQKYRPSEVLTSFFDEVHGALQSSQVNHLREDLEERPVNGLLLFQGGQRPDFTVAREAFGRRQAALYSSDFASKGLARGCGLEEMAWPKEHKKYEHVHKISESLASIMEAHHFFVVESYHLWQSTQNGRLLEKIKTIEYLDRKLIGPLIEFTEESHGKLLVRPLRLCDIRTGALVAGQVPLITYSCAK